MMKIKLPKKHGFTLIEMIMAVFVFMILFLIAASFVKLAAGSTKSNRTKLLTSDVRSALDTIGQKMNGANGYAILSTGGSTYGFRVTGNILTIINFDGTSNNCTSIGKDGSSIYMDVSGCTGTLTNDKQVMTGANVYVENLTFTSIVNGAKPTTISPYLTITIQAHDIDPKYTTDNVINLQTSYTMDYQTIKRLQAQ